ALGDVHAPAEKRDERERGDAEHDHHELELCQAEWRVQRTRSRQEFCRAPLSALNSGSRFAQETGRSKSLARLSGIAIASPMSGSTISRNFAGWAVETRIQRASERSDAGIRSKTSAAVA